MSSHASQIAWRRASGRVNPTIARARLETCARMLTIATTSRMIPGKSCAGPRANAGTSATAMTSAARIQTRHRAMRRAAALRPSASRKGIPSAGATAQRTIATRIRTGNACGAHTTPIRIRSSGSSARIRAGNAIRRCGRTATLWDPSATARARAIASSSASAMTGTIRSLCRRHAPTRPTGRAPAAGVTPTNTPIPMAALPTRRVR
mmetsp:Transcript_6112/g.20949  ORF Transcript_6112/g.20949 Transcript_6112/m.20949 type:complete len:207 (+) Transcript_6112:528-1148(+)